MAQNGSQTHVTEMEYTELSVEERQHILRGLIKNAEQQHFEAMCNVVSFADARAPHEERARTLAQAIQRLRSLLVELSKGGK